MTAIVLHALSPLVWLAVIVCAAEGAVRRWWREVPR